jgi:hypothetical protein
MWVLKQGKIFFYFYRLVILHQLAVIGNVTGIPGVLVVTQLNFFLNDLGILIEKQSSELLVLFYQIYRKLLTGKHQPSCAWDE